jgi:hypothetical protein
MKKTKRLLSVVLALSLMLSTMVFNFTANAVDPLGADGVRILHDFEGGINLNEYTGFSTYQCAGSYTNAANALIGTSSLQINDTSSSAGDMWYINWNNLPSDATGIVMRLKFTSNQGYYSPLFVGDKGKQLYDASNNATYLHKTDLSGNIIGSGTSVENGFDGYVFLELNEANISGNETRLDIGGEFEGALSNAIVKVDQMSYYNGSNYPLIIDQLNPVLPPPENWVDVKYNFEDGVNQFGTYGTDASVVTNNPLIGSSSAQITATNGNDGYANFYKDGQEKTAGATGIAMRVKFTSDQGIFAPFVTGDLGQQVWQGSYKTSIHKTDLYGNPIQAGTEIRAGFDGYVFLAFDPNCVSPESTSLTIGGRFSGTEGDYNANLTIDAISFYHGNDYNAFVAEMSENKVEDAASVLYNFKDGVDSFYTYYTSSSIIKNDDTLLGDPYAQLIDSNGQDGDMFCIENIPRLVGYTGVAMRVKFTSSNQGYYSPLLIGGGGRQYFNATSNSTYMHKTDLSGNVIGAGTSIENGFDGYVFLDFNTGNIKSTDLTISIGGEFNGAVAVGDNVKIDQISFYSGADYSKLIQEMAPEVIPDFITIVHNFENGSNPFGSYYTTPSITDENPLIGSKSAMITGTTGIAGNNFYIDGQAKPLNATGVAMRVKFTSDQGHFTPLIIGGVRVNYEDSAATSMHKTDLVGNVIEPGTNIESGFDGYVFLDIDPRSLDASSLTIGGGFSVTSGTYDATVKIDQVSFYRGNNYSAYAETMNGVPSPVIDGINNGDIVTSATPTFSNCTVTLDGASYISGTAITTVGVHMLIGTNQGITRTITFTVVKYGDVNINGVVNLSDLVLVRDHLLGVQPITGADKLFAGDLYHEGSITLNDLVGIMSMISAT